MLEYASATPKGKADYDTPLHLGPETYTEVSNLMLKSPPEANGSGLLILDGPNDCGPDDWIPKGRQPGPGQEEWTGLRTNSELPAATIGSPEGIDFSLTRQLGDIENDPAAATFGAVSSEPDVYVFTANSAIPVAEAVRAYLDEAGKERPAMTYIHSNRFIASRYLFAYDMYPGPRDPEVVESYESEVSRLVRHVAGAEHVCLVDQHTSYGVATTYAYHLLSSAGAQAISTIRGLWYHDVDPSEVSLPSVTSPAHREFMRNIGVEACKRYDQQPAS